MPTHARLLLSLLVAGTAALPADGAAQLRGSSDRVVAGWSPILLGIHGGYEYRASAYVVGAHMRIPIHPSGYLELVPNGDVVFKPREKDYMAGADLVVVSGGKRGGIYAGGGVTWRRALFDGERSTRRVPTIVVGIRSPALLGSRLGSQVEVRWIRTDTQVKPKLLSLGINVPLWGW